MKSCKTHNERLEFVGDSVVNLVAAQLLSIVIQITKRAS